MAIQVGGTTVLNNSRVLTNITGADAGTVAALGTAGVGGGWDIATSATYSVSNGSISVGAGLYLVNHILGYYSGTFTRRFTGGSGKVGAFLAGNDLSVVSYSSASTINLDGGAYSKIWGFFQTDSTATFQNTSGTTAYLYRLQS